MNFSQPSSSFGLNQKPIISSKNQEISSKITQGTSNKSGFNAGLSTNSNGGESRISRSGVRPLKPQFETEKNSTGTLPGGILQRDKNPSQQITYVNGLTNHRILVEKTNLNTNVDNSSTQNLSTPTK